MERTPRESAASGMTFMLPSPRRRPIRWPLEWCPRNPLARGAGRGGEPLRGTVASARCRRRKPHSRRSFRVPGAGCDSACSAEGPPAPPGAVSTSFWDRTLDASPTVHLDRAPSDHGRVVGSEEERRPGKVLRPVEPPERDGAAIAGHALLVHLLLDLHREPPLAGCLKRPICCVLSEGASTAPSESSPFRGAGEARARSGTAKRRRKARAALSHMSSPTRQECSTFERRLCRRNESWGEVSEGGRSPPPRNLAPSPHAQRTESTPRVRPSGAALHLDLFEQPASFSASC